MSLSLLKIPVLVTMAVCLHAVFTSPNPPATSEEQVSSRGIERIFKSSLRPFSFATKCMIWIAMLSESGLILAAAFPSSPFVQDVLTSLTGSPDLPAPPLKGSPVFLLGAAVAVAGSVFRLSAYRALGRHFTFELALQRGHRLVTAFPYSRVRHPSYTGVLGAMGGAHLALLGAGGGLVRTGALNFVAVHPVAGGLGIAAVVAGQLGSIIALVARTRREDAMMSAEFGDEWDDWAARVPYRLVPGVY